ncbi:MAG: hypothetical protein HY912_18755 [Desulfomonile tiedjei]|uniref:Uncharacterized protein n=1 Tax=Desulfomonile tiedjei TaxID=2358 RepID=A0A9D6Z523_9BACT|nr:hypothetical protein [Desulfomonile tiedjei]
MRSIVIAVAICVALTTVWIGNAQAVGLYVVGKEDCNCSPLVARGIIPDPLNKLKEAFLLSHIASALDKMAIEIKGVFDQFGKPPVSDAAAVPPETTETKEKPSVEEKPAKVKKPSIEKKSEKKEKKAGIQSAKADKSKKKKRVKVPSRVM